VSDQTQRSPEEIRTEIEQTREELADTAAALAYKTDVKARAKERVDEIKGNVTSRASHLKDKTPDAAGSAASAVTTGVKQHPLPTAAIAAAVLGFAMGYLIATRDGN
jgi:ElaB/YqjD/DUF883 family membrane-anchored ribosome-binding protein